VDGGWSHWNWVLSWFEAWITCGLRISLHQEFHELTRWLQCKISRWDSTSADFQGPDGIGAIGAKLKTYGLGGLGGLPLYPLYPLYHSALNITVICIFWFGKDPKAKLGLNRADLSHHVPLCLEGKAQFATIQSTYSQASVDVKIEILSKESFTRMMPGSVDLTERRVRNDPFQKTTFGKISFWNTKQRNKMETVWRADIGCRTCFRKRRTKGKLLDGLQFTNWTCAPCRWRRFQMPWSFHELKDRNVAFDAMQLSKRSPQCANQSLEARN